MANDKQFIEQRRAPRRAALMQASIFHPLQTERLRCIVRDISQDGALMDFSHPKKLPALFWLRLEGEATLRLCTTAWRSESQLGVEFSEQILERRRAERWTGSHTDWSLLRAHRQNPIPGPEASLEIRWSTSLVCLRAN